MAIRHPNKLNSSMEKKTRTYRNASNKVISASMGYPIFLFSKIQEIVKHDYMHKTIKAGMLKLQILYLYKNMSSSGSVPVRSLK